MSDARPWWLTPVSEMEPVPEEALAPRRELTQEEHTELLRRLNTPGGAHIILTADEWDHIAELTPVRDAAQVRELRLAIAAENPREEFIAGIIAGLAFAYGEAARGPVSGEAPDNRPPTCGDLGGEEAFVQRALQGQPMAVDRPISRSRDFMVGAEHVLMWLQCRTDAPPWDVSGIAGGRA